MNSQNPWPLGALAAAEALSGRDEEAREAVVRLNGVDPNFTLQTVQSFLELQDDPTYKAQLARIIDGLRKAGLPEN